MLNSREQEIVHLSLGASDGSLRRMVAQMHQNGRLTPGLIMRALCTGDIAFFEAAIAVRGDVPLGNAQVLIHDPSRRGLAALYAKAGMPESLYPVVGPRSRWWTKLVSTATNAIWNDSVRG